MIDKELLVLLVCPKTHQPLSLAEKPLVDRLNEWIAACKLKNTGGQVIESRIDGGLLCQEAGLVYPIIDDIPVLLADEAIPLAQLDR